jgi:hypothetical protein
MHYRQRPNIGNGPYLSYNCNAQPLQKQKRRAVGSLFLFSKINSHPLLPHSLHLHSVIRCLHLHEVQPGSNTQIVGANGVVKEFVSITNGGEHLLAG